MQNLKCPEYVNRALELKRTIELEYKLIHIKEMKLQRLLSRLNKSDKDYVNTHKLDCDWW